MNEQKKNERRKKMKLRNKKTGEIKEVEKGHFLICYKDDYEATYVTSLAELCEEWEDYKEPDTYYYVSDCGNIEVSTNDHGYNMPEEIWRKAMERRKEAGNYFETEEEAEKAVEKLKALKRLKDKGFVFKHHEVGSVCTQITEVWIRADFSNGMAFLNDTIKADLDLLFGGKE